MPLKFGDICSLLDDLETVEKKDVLILRRGTPDHRRVTRHIISTFFKTHRRTIDTPSANGVATLSTLFPEKRTDRVYGLQEARLSGIFSRCLSFGTADTNRLRKYRMPGHGDLGECIERVQRVHDGALFVVQPVLVDELDSALEQLAAASRFSSPKVRSRFHGQIPEELLTPLLWRMKARELKWLTRLLLKDFAPVVLDYDHVMQTYHFLLPGLLRFQDSFESAICMLKGPLARYHAAPDTKSQAVFKLEAATLIRPHVGTKVGRPAFHKARSVGHCLKMVNSKRWSVERKYDGEYCEVHVDLQNQQGPIKIFSKSGKDSTSDRHKLLPTLRECLRLGSKNCVINRQCILAGELVVYCDQTQDILPFHKIRKHVSRSGSFLGTVADSQPHEHEHLMIIFFDVLLLDEDVTLIKTHVDRRRTLSTIVRKIPGRAMTAEWKLIDFAQTHAKEVLLQQFVASITHRHEGLILKPADAPYFSLLDDEPTTWHSGFIKLKKDYMQALGEQRDIADLLIVGTSYDARQARRSSLSDLQATTFHLACVMSAEDVRFGKTARLKVVGTISAYACIPPPVLKALNNVARFHSRPCQVNDGHLADPDKFDLTWTATIPKPDMILGAPVLVEVLGSGFEKPPNCGFFMLRHARILKMHLDREWQHATRFDELQRMATVANEAPDEGESQEMARLLDKMQCKMQHKADRGELRSSLTPRSPATTVRSTSSPRSPLSLRRDNGNARSTTLISSSLRVRTRGQDERSVGCPQGATIAAELSESVQCSPAKAHRPCMSSRPIAAVNVFGDDTLALPTPPTSSAIGTKQPQTELTASQFSLVAAAASKRQADPQAITTFDPKRRKVSADSVISCAHSEGCRWYSTRLYLTVPFRDHFTSHGGIVVTDLRFALPEHAASIADTQDVRRPPKKTLVVLVDPKNALDEAWRAVREVEELSITLAEFWDSAVLQKSCVPSSWMITENTPDDLKQCLWAVAERTDCFRLRLYSSDDIVAPD